MHLAGGMLSGCTVEANEAHADLAYGGGVSVADAKRRVGGRVALMGGVHNVKLARGTLQDVTDDCRRCLTEGAPGGGYILACGDMLPTETSREKVEAMVAAAHGYRY